MSFHWYREGQFLIVGILLQYEAIPESLKNVVLVMNATGLLVQPMHPDTRDERQKQLWDATFERIQRFLPGFLLEVLPEPMPAHLTQTQPPAQPLSVPPTPVPT